MAIDFARADALSAAARAAKAVNPNATFSSADYASGNIPAPPQPSFSSPAPSYSSNAPSYSIPAPSYNGPANMIGNVSGSQNIGKSYQDIYNSTRNATNANSQLNTYSDKGGNVYDTTQMTPQQIFALSLSKDNNPKSADILKGMGLDMNGNPTSPIPAPPAPSTSANNNSTSATAYAPGPAVKTGEMIPKPPGGDSFGFGFSPDRQSLNSGGYIGQNSSIPAPPSPYGNGSIDTNSLQAEAASRIAKQMAALQGSVNAAKTGLKNNYDYNNQVTADNRTLRNSQFQETNNPFSGKFAYDKTNTLRNDNLADTATNKDYQSNVAAQDQKLADFQALAPEQQQAQYDDLLRQERAYANQQDQLNLQRHQLAQTQSNADRTFNYTAGQDAITNNRNATNDNAANTGYYNPSGMNADQINQEIASNSAAYGGASSDQQQQLHARNVYLNGLLGKSDSTGNGDYVGGNPGGVVGYRTTQGQQNDNAKQVDQRNFAYQQARDAIKDKQYQQQFDMDTQKYGLDYALKQATLQNQITNDQAQRAIGYMGANTAAANGAASRANMAADNTRADNAVKLTADQHKFAVDVQNELSQAKSRDDVMNFFNANAGEITSRLGPDAFTKMKNDTLAQYDKVTQTNKQDTNVREKALAAAQKDMRWDDKRTDKNALIKEYEGYYQ